MQTEEPHTIEEDIQTTAIGLYHFAVSYRRAADALGTVELRATHPDAPREFLYYHAIELYLKAYLRGRGYTVAKLTGLRHRIDKLRAAFEGTSGFLMDEDRSVLDLMASGQTVIRARYIRTGYFVKPSLQACARTAKSLHQTVRDDLRRAGCVIAD